MQNESDIWSLESDAGSSTSNGQPLATPILTGFPSKFWVAKGGGIYHIAPPLAYRRSEFFPRNFVSAKIAFNFKGTYNTLLQIWLDECV